MTTSARVFRSKRKCQLRQEIHGSVVNSLPSEITIEILSRLPTDSILQCRLVCKPWRNLLRQPSFAHLHLHQLSRMSGNNRSCHGSVIGAKVRFGLLFSFKFPPKDNNELYYAEYDEQSDMKLRKINQPPIVSHSLIGSCNGLICFFDLDVDCYVVGERLTVYEPSYISNPITREYTTFPKLEIIGENKIDTMVCGFGYHPSIHKFKIVKIYYIQNQPLGRIQVYTLGGGCNGWRDVGEIAYSLRLPRSFMHGTRSAFGVFANGALHWLDSEQKIVSFDLAEEKLYLLPSPPFVYAANVANCFQLRSLGGCLCFVHLKKCQFLDIWFLRKKGESSSCDVNEQEYDLLNWIKEFSIPITGDYYAQPIALTENGELLLSYRSDLCCYDPKTAVLEKLMDHGYYTYRLVVPHVNSFISLKALGEKCRSRKSYKANPSPREFIIKKRRNA